MKTHQQAEAHSPEADVILYCTPWCPGCRAARAFLKERGWAGGNETTPTFDIRGQIVVDWDKQRVMELLGID
jgi:glutaredoxin